MFENDWIVDAVEDNEYRFAVIAMTCLVAGSVFVTVLIQTLS